MARSEKQRLDDVALRVEQWRDANAEAAMADARVTAAMVRARLAGISLRRIAAVADVSDVTVLNRTRDEVETT